MKNDVIIFIQGFSGLFGIERNRADYFKAPMFTPYYGGKENPDGTPGGKLFRRVAFELLGAKGYEEGMLPYITDQYKAQAEAEGKVFSDTYIFGKIFGSEFKNYYEFKMAEYQKRIDKVGDLKPITINYQNKSITIDSFEKMKEMLLQ